MTCSSTLYLAIPVAVAIKLGKFLRERGYKAYQFWYQLAIFLFWFEGLFSGLIVGLLFASQLTPTTDSGPIPLPRSNGIPMLCMWAGGMIGIGIIGWHIATLRPLLTTKERNLATMWLEKLDDHEIRRRLQMSDRDMNLLTTGLYVKFKSVHHKTGVAAAALREGLAKVKTPWGMIAVGVIPIIIIILLAIINPT